MVYKTTPLPPQGRPRRRTRATHPDAGGRLKPPVENSDLEIAYRRTQDGGEFIGPDGVKVTLNVIPISPQGSAILQAFFRNATLARTWPPGRRHPRGMALGPANPDPEAPTEIRIPPPMPATAPTPRNWNKPSARFGKLYRRVALPRRSHCYPSELSFGRRGWILCRCGTG